MLISLLTVLQASTSMGNAWSSTRHSVVTGPATSGAQVLVHRKPRHVPHTCKTTQLLSRMHTGLSTHSRSTKPPNELNSRSRRYIQEKIADKVNPRYCTHVPSLQAQLNACLWQSRLGMEPFHGCTVRGVILFDGQTGLMPASKDFSRLWQLLHSIGQRIHTPSMRYSMI